MLYPHTTTHTHTHTHKTDQKRFCRFRGLQKSNYAQNLLGEKDLVYLSCTCMTKLKSCHVCQYPTAFSFAMKFFKEFVDFALDLHMHDMSMQLSTRKHNKVEKTTPLISSVQEKIYIYKRI